METIDNPRLVLGIKIRALRIGRGLTLQALARSAGLSVSYLSEIEKGKKYPKPERLVALADALELPFDELVSLRVPHDLSALKALFGSSWLRAFPFDLFGVRPEDLLAKVSGDPRRGAALMTAVAEVGSSYDVNVEHFLLAALRAYQQLNGNFFEGLEDAAEAFRLRRGWAGPGEPDAAELRGCLEGHWRYRVDEKRLGAEPDLASLRSVFRPGPPPTLFVNPRLMSAQRAFVLAREIGYRELGLEERAASSPWLGVESFEQVLHNFQASYFAGALLMPRAPMRADLEELFAAHAWAPEKLIAILRRYAVTPETLLHRLTQVVPRFFDLEDYFFFRFSTDGGGAFRLTKWLNTSPVPVPRGFGLSEHYCRRWPALTLLLAHGAELGDPRHEICVASRTTFADGQEEFLEISMARGLALEQGRLSAVTVGLRMGPELERAIAFAGDPALPRRVVGLTCERCGLGDCGERVVPAALWERREASRRGSEAIAALTR